MIPKSEYRALGCGKAIWEHRSEEDPGEPDWIFRDDKRLISNTQLRRVLRIDDVATDSLHVHHKHIPINLCEADECERHYRRNSTTCNPFLENNQDDSSKETTEDFGFPSEAEIEDFNSRRSRPLRWVAKYEIGSGRIHHRDLTNNQYE